VNNTIHQATVAIAELKRGNMNKQMRKLFGHSRALLGGMLKAASSPTQDSGSLLGRRGIGRVASAGMKSCAMLALLALGIASLGAGKRAAAQTGERAQASATRLPAEVQAREAWAKTMHHTHAPKAGCFHAEYPSTEWQEVPCAPPNGWRPDLSRRLNKKGGGGETVGGNDGDIIAEAPTGLVFSSVEGSFPTVNGVTSETDSGGIQAGANEYTLQLNTNFSPTAIGLCSGFPNCQTIVQFVLSTNAPTSLIDATPTNQTQIFIEPTLYNYGTDVDGGATNICPSGWSDFGQIGTGDYCAINLPPAVIDWNPPTNLGQLPITDLADLILSGSAMAGGNDSVTATYNGVASMAATVPDNYTDISSVWNNAEFNIFGNASGSEAVFNGPTPSTANNGSTVVVQSAVTYTNGSTSAPNCVFTSGPTLETNNLNLATAPGTTTPPTCCAYSGATPGIQGASPGIQFVESNNPNEWAACPAPITWGDPHITTVDGTIYDFQGAGEYVALQDTDGTEVQVRQSPIAGAAPGNWSPASPAKYQNDGLVSCLSSNTAAAAKVGTHRVTYEPSFGVANPSGLQLRIDGKVTTTGENFGDGGRVEKTSDGIEIHFPDGKVLTVSGSLPYLTLDFSSLGVVSPSVGGSKSGLAGDVPNGNWLPRLPNGAAVGSMPATLHERYVTLNQTFGNAWRVAKNASLFDYAPGTSTATFTTASWPVENAKSCMVPSQKPAVPVSAAVAEEACKAISDANLHSSCVFDVKATGITHLADTYLTTERIHAKLAPKPIIIRPVLTDTK